MPGACIFDRDAVLRQVPGRRLREPSDGELGGGVQRNPGIAHVTRLGRRTLMIFPPWPSSRNALAAAWMPHTTPLKLMEKSFSASSGVVSSIGARCNAGVVDDDIQTTELGHGPVDRREHVVPVGDVDPQGRRTAVLPAEPINDPSCGFGVQTGGRHREAIGVDPLDNRLSDTLPAACDQGDLPILCTCHFLTPLHAIAQPELCERVLLPARPCRGPPSKAMAAPCAP